jgi:SAM-dependent methyltransferase
MAGSYDVDFTLQLSPSKTARIGLDQPVGTGPFNFVPGDQLTIAGWAFIDPPAAIDSSVSLEVVHVLSGTVTPVETVRSPRPDVAEHFGRDLALTSGFTARHRIDGRTRMEHRVRLRQGDGSVSYPPEDLFSFFVGPSAYEDAARRDLAARFLRGNGLEIGALQRRLQVPPRCSVTYVDRMPLSELQRHYPELANLAIQAPDVIDNGETLATFPSDSQDFVVANHFLEHCENPIQTIANLARVVRQGGILFMAVPDKRFTFDAERPATSFAVVADAFRLGRRADREPLYSEWASLVLHVPAPQVDETARRLLNEGYSIHFNVWTLADLLDFLSRARREFRLPIELEWVVSSENEVILILGKRTAPGPGPA